MGKHDVRHLTFSPSGLNTFKDCHRCGFLEYHALSIDPCPRPRGIFPTLPNGIDKVVKDYHDTYRAKKELPPYLRTHVEGILFPNREKIKQLRFWKTGPTITLDYKETRVTLRGALDDLILRLQEDTVSPFDSKSKGFEPKDDGSQYYQLQLDCYDLMLGLNGFKTSGVGYLAYVWPAEMRDPSNPLMEGTEVPFSSKTYTLQTVALRARNALYEAADIVLKGVLPPPSETCETCAYVTRRRFTEAYIHGKSEPTQEGAQA